MPLERVQLSGDLEALDRWDENDVTVTVRRTGDNLKFAAAVAQADNFGDRWWVSRVIVRERSERGKGLGSLALRRMLAIVSKIASVPVYVSPGGYDDNTGEQFRFYLKNGFKRVTGDAETLVWTSSERTET